MTLTVSNWPAQLLPVLRQLSADHFQSGEHIAQRLSCSRATVHNAIRSALEIGFAVHGVQGRGYRLAMPVSWLNAERLVAEFSLSGITLHHLDQVPSTNALLMEWAAGGLPHRSLLSTEWQSHGRGRRGRAWFAGLGGGLTFSYLWRSTRPAAQLSGLSLAVGLALVKGLRGLGLPNAQVKWPNDIQVDGAKLAGILIELAHEKCVNDMLAPSTVVIGVGLNVLGGEALTQQLGQPVTDLQSHLLSPHSAQTLPLDRNDLLLHLIRQLDLDLLQFEREGFAPFQNEWHACHAYQGQPVAIHSDYGEPIVGTALGVDVQGALLLDTLTGVRAIHAGEVSLRSRVA